MDRCRFGGHKRSARQCLACESQWHLSRQRELSGILGRALAIDPEVRGCCALRICPSTRKVRSDFARWIASELRRDRLRLLVTRSGTSRAEGARPRRSSPEGRAKSGWDVGIRTPITASRARCPTVERRPNRWRETKTIVDQTGPGKTTGPVRSRRLGQQRIGPTGAVVHHTDRDIFQGQPLNR